MTNHQGLSSTDHFSIALQIISEVKAFGTTTEVVIRNDLAVWSWGRASERPLLRSQWATSASLGQAITTQGDVCVAVDVGSQSGQTEETLMNSASTCLSTGSAVGLSAECCFSSYKHLLWRVQGPFFIQHLFSQMILLPCALTSGPDLRLSTLLRSFSWTLQCTWLLQTLMWNVEVRHLNLSSDNKIFNYGCEEGQTLISRAIYWIKEFSAVWYVVN